MPLPQLNYKKIGIIAGFVVVSISLAIGIVYVFFFSGQEEQLPPGFIAGIDQPGQLPGTGTGRPGDTAFPVPAGTAPVTPRNSQALDKVAQGNETNVLPVNKSRAQDPTPTRDGNDVAFYDPAKGQFFRLSSDGTNKTLLTDEKFFSVSSVAWSPSRERAVIEYPDGSNIIYDFTKRESVTLPQAVMDPVFSPTSENIAFKLETDNPDDNWLVVTDKNGDNPKFIEPIGSKGDQVQVAFSPTEEAVALFHKPVGANQEEVFLIGQAGENFKSFVVEGLNFAGKFSPDGTRLLYHTVSQNNSFNPSLYVVDIRGANIGNNQFALGLNTWIDKCVFSSNNQDVYCAVPRDLSNGLGLTPGAVSLTSDTIFKLDLDTGIKNEIAIPANQDGLVNVAVTSIWLDSAERNVFFWDARAGQVYKMRLK